MPPSPALKDCPACHLPYHGKSTGLKGGTGPGLCEGGCGGSGKVPMTREDLAKVQEGAAKAEPG